MIILQAKRVCPHGCHAKAETRPGQGQGGFQLCLCGGFCQGLIEVGDDVVRVLDTDGQAHDPRTCARCFLLFGCQLAVRG